jgi:hypothetical protein
LQVTRTLHSAPAQFATAELRWRAFAGRLGESSTPHPDVVVIAIAATIAPTV